MSLPLEIIYEDAYLLAVNKPAGIIVEGNNERFATLENLALKYLETKSKGSAKLFIGTPHRLDRPVSGLVLFAKKKSTLKMLGEMFSKREIKKTYLAITDKRPPAEKQILSSWLIKNEAERKAIIVDAKSNDAVKVVLNYRLLGRMGTRYLLEVELITGKYHQIRAQLAYIGCPVTGDLLYGSKIAYRENAICLHAHELKFIHPNTGEKMVLRAEAPQDWEIAEHHHTN